MIGDFPACAPHAKHGTWYQGVVENFMTKLLLCHYQDWWYRMLEREMRMVS